MPTPNRYAITALIALLASPVGAEPLWLSPELQLETRRSSDTTQGHIVVRCDNIRAADYCDTSAATYARAREQAARIGETLLEIREWFDDIGLFPSNLRLRRNNERQVLLQEGFARDEDGTRALVGGVENIGSLTLEVGTVALDDRLSQRLRMSGITRLPPAAQP